MEKQTIAAADECPDCVPDPVLAARFRVAIDAVSGKWKIDILYLLLDGTLRFGELRRALPDVTQHVLTAQLRALETDGLLTRTVHAEVPPRVEYALTEAAYALLPMFRALRDWADAHGDDLIARRGPPPPPRRNSRHRHRPGRV